MNNERVVLIWAIVFYDRLLYFTIGYSSDINIIYYQYLLSVVHDSLIFLEIGFYSNFEFWRY